MAALLIGGFMSVSALIQGYADSRRKVLFHQEDDKIIIEQRQDVSHIVEAAKILADQPPGKDFRHMAFVPETVLNDAFVNGWIHDPKAWKAWLNNPDNARFRTWNGRA